MRCPKSCHAPDLQFHGHNKGYTECGMDVGWETCGGGGDDGLVRVWNVGGGEAGQDGSGAEMTLCGHGDRVTCVKVAWMDDG